MQERPYRTIEARVDGAVATITLAIPERKNPIGPLMVNELLYALDDAKDDKSVRVVVLTGKGGAFSAGGDLKQMSGGDEEPALAPKGDYADLLLRFRSMGKPVVARVEGPAMGGGLGLVASCQIAIAGQSAVLATPEVRRGLWPMQIMTALEPLVPRRQLMSMMLLGEKLSADQALEAGLLTTVVPDEQLDTAVADVAAKLAAQSPTAMRMGLDAFYVQEGQPIEQALPYLRDQLFALLSTDDAREGLAAFFEKREPKWKGH
jgi:enoyl-CoA hydratase/carnithine racemase